MSDDAKFLLAFIAFFIVGGALAGLAVDREHQREHERYVKCVETGEKPIQCSFATAFKGEAK